MHSNRCLDIREKSMASDADHGTRKAARLVSVLFCGCGHCVQVVGVGLPIRSEKGT